MSRYIPKDAIPRFERGLDKIYYFRELTGLTIPQIEKRANMTTSQVLQFLCNRDKVKPTPNQQKNMDQFVKAFGLNPNWVYGESTKIIANRDKLTPREWYTIHLDTVDKRKACIERFKWVLKIDETTYKELSTMGYVSDQTIWEWLSRRGETHTRWVPLMILYSDKTDLNKDWLFMGIGNQIRKDLIEPTQSVIKPKRRKPRWYVVNTTDVYLEIGWFIRPEAYTIKKAVKSADVSKDYLPERVKVNGVDTIRYRSERAICACKTRKEAEKKLAAEIKRIQTEGKSAWKAPWSMEAVL